MKKITTLSLIVLLGCAATLPASAQSRILTRPGQNADDRLKAVPIRAEIKAEVEDRDDDKREKQEEMRREQYEKNTNRIYGQLSSIFDKIQKAHDRIEVRANSFADKGVDIDPTMSLLAEAQISLNAAKEQSVKLESIFEQELSEEVLQQVRQQMNDIKLDVRAAHDALRKSLVALKDGIVDMRGPFEDRDDRKDDDDSYSYSDSGIEIEADIFTDITIVKIEQNDVKEYVRLQTKDRGEIIAQIAEKINLSKEQVASIIEIETEDRAHREDDLD